MRRQDLHDLWRAPRPPDVPARVWRDWALLAASLAGVVLEAALRRDLVWWPVAVALTAWLCALPMWRRTRPLATVVAGFGAMLLLQVATLIAAPRESVGLYTGMVVLVLVYALPRWGSGREVVLGGAVILATFALSVVTDDLPIGEQLAGFCVLGMPAVVGGSVRLQETARRRQLEQARSGERLRLARELHDTVAHHVSAIVIRAQAGRVAAGSDPAAAIAALETVEEEGARTLEEMRVMVAALREGPTGAELAPQAGIADLRRLVRAPGGRLPVELRIDGELDGLPTAVDAAVYRIVQESVTNAARHALDATGIAVRVTGGAHSVRVTVRDDGARQGRSPRPGRPLDGPGPADRRDGYGLAGLRERAHLLGGVLRAGPGADGGWCVEAELPTGRADDGADPSTGR